MADPSKLKRKAAEFEQKRQYDRAVAVYEEILQEVAGHEGETDIHLYNRVGDLYLRLGQPDTAIDRFERAVDLYAEHGFFNNAIALCNKILRHVPNRSSIYYKLGKIGAKKGFVRDAKKNFLEYADAMQRGGRMDEAFRALTEFADLSVDQDDVRLMLADQLAKAGRNDEAVEQLQLVYEQFERQGRTTEASATLDRMRALDATIEPRKRTPATPEKVSDLVFLDMGYDNGVPTPTPAHATRIDDIDPTLLYAADPGVRVTGTHPLTTGEFAALDLPAPADILPLTAVPHDLALGDLPPLASTIADEISSALSGVSSSSTDTASPLAPLELPAPPQVEVLEVAPPPPEEFVDLQDWLREDEPANAPRKDQFADMLTQFKQGIAAGMEDTDASAHYDLGVAFKEMGLIDDAISEFQKAAKVPEYRARSHEAIGQAFIEKKQYEVAIASLGRAVRELGLDEESLVGVLYLLGYASEALGRGTQAAEYYHRVVAVDVKFRDALTRLTALQHGAS